MAKTSGDKLLVIVLAVIAAPILLCCGGGFVASLLRETPVPEPSTANAVTTRPAKRSGVIPGIEPVDAYQEFVNRGFTLTRNFTDLQNEWTATDGSDLSIDVFGPPTGGVTMVRATAKRGGGDFLSFAGSLPFDDAQPEAAQAWIRQNLGANASKQFGSCSFSLSANGSATQLTIRPKGR